MKFIGLQCTLNSLGDTLEEQLATDGCVCPACWLAYKTLYRSVEKHYVLTRHQKAIKKEVDRYWENLKKMNKKRNRAEKE